MTLQEVPGRRTPLMANTRKKRCTTCHVLRLASQFSTAGARVCNKCKRAGSRASARARHLDENYGITLEEADAILEAQGGKCAGCGGTRRYELHVDHDHKVEAALLAAGWEPKAAARESVRGRVCARCNKVLRDTRDNGDTLVALAHYLANPPAKRVLRRKP